MKRYDLKNVTFSRIALVDKGASFDQKTGDGAHVLIFKRATAEDEHMTETLETLTKKLADLTAENAELKKKAPAAAPAPEDILKGASPEVRALLEKTAADLKKAQDEATANGKAISELQKAARVADIRKRVDAFRHLSGDKAVLTDVVRLVEDADKDVAKKFEEILKAHDAQLQKGGVTGAAVGSRGTSETAGSGIVERIEALIDGVIQKDAKTTRETAMAKVFADNPALYAEYSEAVTTKGSKKDPSAE